MIISVLKSTDCWRRSLSTSDPPASSSTSCRKPKPPLALTRRIVPARGRTRATSSGEAGWPRGRVWRRAAAELCRGGIRPGLHSDPLAERAHGFEDVRQTTMRVVEHRDLRAFELTLEIGLRCVDDDEVGFQRDDPLDIRVE